MKRLFVTGMILAWIIPISLAQDVPEEGPEEVRLTVIPAAEPKPAMKYQLLPELLDRKCGNAATLYLEVIASLEKKEFEQYRDKIDVWEKLPTNKLPGAEVKEILEAYRKPLQQIELAARLSYCDFELPTSEGFDMELPSVGRLREVAKVLALKIRLEVADGKIDEAMHDFQTGFAMARHVENGVTLIEDLVAMAIVASFTKELEDFIQTVESPNLYWALANLPRPMVDIRKSMEYERHILYFELPKLRGKDIEKMTPKEWKKFQSDIVELLSSAGVDDHGEGENDGDDLWSAVLALKAYPNAKQYLLKNGFSPEKIKKMPPMQAILIYMNRTYLKWRDDMFKWYELPYWQAHEGLQRTEAKFEKWVKGGGRSNLLVCLLPSLGRASFLQARLQRQFAALRTIEAVRMYAANHKGKLPSKLADIIEAPTPIDPVLGKPFGYKVEGNTFTLDAPAPSGMERKDGRRYVVTVKNKIVAE